VSMTAAFAQLMPLAKSRGPAGRWQPPAHTWRLGARGAQPLRDPPPGGPRGRIAADHARSHRQLLSRDSEQPPSPLLAPRSDRRASAVAGTPLAPLKVVKNHLVIATSTLVAGALAVALILRPSRSLSPGPELGAPEHISPAARAIIRSKMQRHREQLGGLLSRVVALDYDGAARSAGEIFDEPALARPVTGDELNGVLPARFFVLQDALRAQARQMVEAAARRDSARFGQAFGALTGTCIACHDTYLHGEDH